MKGTSAMVAITVSLWKIKSYLITLLDICGLDGANYEDGGYIMVMVHELDDQYGVKPFSTFRCPQGSILGHFYFDHQFGLIIF